ncbi:hypothetical protein Plo01_66040 [Planobispora longispora]|uniref:Uncharacterized protein n=1 Tax=Planobispora longispora TaxID=28887 RepID=A0A8J3RRY1_9ACTN|nr:hypothetical protein Plo01_66040 [Planobispora longispora]
MAVKAVSRAKARSITGSPCAGRRPRGAREVPEAFVTRAVCLTTRPEKDDRSRRPGIQVRERTVGGDAPADTLGRAGRDIVNACHSMEFRLVPPVRPS